MLEQIREVATGCGIERSEAELLVEEARRLAEEISACGVAHAAELARRFEQLVERVGQRDEPDPPTSPARPDPSEFINVRCLCNGEDVTDRVSGLLRLFFSRRKDEYDEHVGEAFLNSAEEFSAWAKGGGHDEASAKQPQAAALVGCKHGSFCFLFDHVLGHRQVAVKGLDKGQGAGRRPDDRRRGPAWRRPTGAGAQRARGRQDAAAASPPVGRRSGRSCRREGMMPALVRLLLGFRYAGMSHVLGHPAVAAKAAPLRAAAAGGYNWFRRCPETSADPRKIGEVFFGRCETPSGKLFLKGCLT